MSMPGQYPLAVMFTSRNTARSVAFYRDILGFEVEGTWPGPANPLWANVTLDRQSIMIGAHVSAEQAGETCGGDAGAAQSHKTLGREFETNRPGVGVVTYILVQDVDHYHAGLARKGVRGLPPPRTQFYGIRDFGLQDPDGYRLIFYSPVTMTSCQSCGMPLKDAAPGQMYCPYCTDAAGRLKPYESVLEGTIAGYFMDLQDLPRPDAEQAAKAHLARMPAWSMRG